MEQVTRLTCPVTGCRWTHDDPGPVTNISAVMHAAPEEAAKMPLTSHWVNLDQVIRDHLGTHSLEDWVRELARLRDEAAGYRKALEAITEIPEDGGTCYDAADVASRALGAGELRSGKPGGHGEPN